MLVITPAAHPRQRNSDLTKACYPNMPQNLSTIDLLMLGDPRRGGECEPIQFVREVVQEVIRKCMEIVEFVYESI